MDVYISIDLEGVAGIVARHQVIPAETHAYRQACRLMTEEANAAVRASADAGATRIVVNDSHARMLNLDPELLDPRAECSIGFPKPYYMMAGIGPRFDAALFVGYHGGAGSAPAILDHTYSSRTFRAVRVNGVRQTETTLNAAMAGHHGVPVAMVSGDEATCAEARAALGPDLPTVARERIAAAARDGLQRVSAGHLHPYVVEPPYVLECDVHTTLAADYCSTIPGVERPAGRTLRFTHDDYPTMFRALLSMAMLGGLAGA